jgi:transposase-like protein
MKFKGLFELMKEYDTEEKCRDYFVKQRWNGNVVCPHCNNDEKNGKIYKTNRGIFRCGCCSKDFSVRTNTFMGDSPIKYQKWFVAIFLLTSHKKGISSLQLAKDIGITQKSAWFIIQRISHIIDTELVKLKGTVEVDETYVGAKESNKHKNKRTLSYDKVKGDKTAMLGMTQRSGKVFLKKFEKINKACITPHIEQHISPRAIVNTDSPIYKGALNERTCRIVNHSAKQYVFEDNTTNRIEGMFSHLKRMINCIHIFLSAKHLQKYANMFCFRMNTRDMDEYSRISVLLSDTGKYTLAV